MVKRKTFLANPNHQHYVSQWGGLDCSANNKKNKVYYKHPSLPYSTEEFDYKENGGKKRFSCESKVSISSPYWGEHDCSAHNKMNGNCNEYPGLSYFTDEH